MIILYFLFKYSPHLHIHPCIYNFIINYIIHNKMLTTLAEYILPSNNPNPKDIDNLLQQNKTLTERVAQLEQKLQKTVEIKQLNINASTLTNDKLAKILGLLGKSRGDVEEERRVLGLQEGYLEVLSKYVELYISQEGQFNQPRVLQRKLSLLNTIIQQAQTLSQSQSNPTTSPLAQQQLSKMKIWHKKLIQSLQKKLCDLVVAFGTHIRINLDDIRCYKDLLNDELYREFVKILYRDVFVYDVPTFSYVLLMPVQISQENGIIVAKRQTFIFSGEKSEQNYHNIEKALIQTQKLAQRLFQTLTEEQRQLHEAIQSQISSCQQDVKSQIQYILPYLSLEKRKKIMGYLCSKNKSETTLYDILVRLRIKGQDGQMMETNISQLVQKIRVNPADISEVIVFLQICASEDKGLNIGFFICDELLKRLEAFVPYADIQRIIQLREDMRFRIQHPS